MAFNTYGIKYAGSKLNLLNYINDTIKDLKIQKVLDGFGGTTRVSQMFAQKGYETTCVDISAWTKTLGTCFLCTKKEKNFYQKYIDELNSLSPCEGWFTNTYALENSELQKAPFQKHNLMKLDSIRQKIKEYDLPQEDKDVLLTSLILALDKVDNTMGHFTSYLAEWSPRSYNDLFLEIPDYNIYKQNNMVIQDDIFNVLNNNNYYDLAYYDPPYGSNNEKMPSSRVRYNSYYHFWTSVILYDNPPVFGKAHRREDSRDNNSSIFEEYRKNNNNEYIAIQAIKDLILKTNAKYILFSYSNGGRATKEELYNIFNSNSKKLIINEINYTSNVMMSMTSTKEWVKNDNTTIEYLFLLEK